MTAPPEQAAGIRLLAGLLSLTVLVLLISELDREKQQLLRPTTIAVSAPEAPQVTAPRRPAMVVQRAPATPLRPAATTATTTATTAPTTAPTAPPRPSPAVAVEQPPPTTPARPGTYQFAYSVNGQPSQAATLQVRRLAAHDVVRDEQTWSTQEDHAVQEHDWTPQRMRTTSSGSCRWSPADTTLVLPLRKGASWTSRTSCHNDDGSTTTSTTSSTVKGWTKVSIGDQRVPTWVVERTVTTVVSSGRATARSWSAVTDFFAPALGLTVVESMQSHYPAPDGSDQTVDAVRRLLSVAAS